VSTDSPTRERPAHPLRICMASSEFAPYAKTGGLADVTAGLSGHLHRAGHDVRPFLPLYARVREAGIPLTPVSFARDVPVKSGPWDFTFSLYTTRVPETGLDVYFVDIPHFFDRPDIYTADSDEHLRFIVFSRAVLESCQRMGWGPHVVHANDWQTAFLPLFLKNLYAWDELFRGTKSLLTIHNIGYQGSFSAAAVGDTHLAAQSWLFHQEDFQAGVINPLKTGILYADALTTVSRTYAEEIQTPEYGAGLDAILRMRRDALFGIVNGVDYREWDPAHDPLIPHPFSAQRPAGKAKNKAELLEALGLDPGAEVPVLGIVSRLVYQKGFDLLFDVMPALLRRRDLRLAVLGNGESRYVEFFTRLERRFPGRVCFFHGYQNHLAHLTEAGADLFLMPSRYEPCGLNQMYSLRYGTLPVVRRTGGLADTVEQADPRAGTGTGFLFDHFTSQGLGWALQLALDTYAERKSWRRLMRNAMSRDFSWARQGSLYERLYRRLSGVT